LDRGKDETMELKFSRLAVVLVTSKPSILSRAEHSSREDGKLFSFNTFDIVRKDFFICLLTE
jgi:hypothetical protein